MAKKITKTTKKKEIVKKDISRKELLSKEEIKFFAWYILGGVVLAVLLKLIFKVALGITFSKFYGVLYMFFVPGLFIFRAIYKHKVYETPWEEYGYPALISWILHSLLIAGISGFFKTAITDFNLYGSSFVLIIVAVIAFQIRK